MNSPTRLLIKNAAVPVAAILLIAASAFAQSSTQIIVTSGDAAPDSDGTFFTVDAPSLNDAGQMAFYGTIANTSGDAFFEAGIFRGDGLTPLLQLARQDASSPGGGTFTAFLDLAINDVGQVAFEASSTGNVSGVYRSDGVTATTINRTGQFLPGSISETFVSLFVSAVNNSGQVLFVCQVNPSGDDVLFVGDGVSTTQIAREGQAPPSGGGSFYDLRGSTINDAGQVAFLATFDQMATDTGIYRADESTVTHLVRVGDAAPVGGGTFNDLRGFAMNSSGLVVFTSTLIGTSEAIGIFSHDGTPTGLAQVVRAGDDAPDGNGTLGGFSAPALNEAGQIAFRSFFISDTSGGTADDEGIFRSDGGTLLQVAREGQAAPDGNGSFSTFDDPALNSAGQIAFLASLTDTAGGSDDDRGLFLFDDTHGLIRIAREGDSLLGSTITGLAFSDSIATSGNEPSGLNNSGQVGYRFSLADGRSGIALWSLSGATIPETGSTTAQPPADPNAALRASLANKAKKLKKKFKKAKGKRQVAKAKKFKKKIKKLKKKLKAL